MMRLSLNSTELFLILSFTCIQSLSFFDMAYASYLISFMVFYCIYIIYKTNKPLISIYTIFISTYFIYLLPYFYYDISFASRETYQNKETSLVTLQCISYFVFVFLFLIYRKGCSTINFSSRVRRVNNPFAYYFSIIGIILFSLLMVNSKGTLLNSTYSELTQDRYPFIGYSIVLVVLAFVSQKSVFKRCLLFLCILFYCLVCMLYGYRLRFLNIGLLTYILFFEHKIKKYVVTLITFSMFFFLSFIGLFRTGVEKVDLMIMLGIHDGQMISNQGGVYLTSNIYTGAVIDGLLTLEQRIGIFIQQVFSAFIPKSLYPDSYSLKSYMKETFDTPGGGFITAYLYVWGGYVAIILAPFLIAHIYKRLFSLKYINAHLFVYFITVAAMFINWFAYTPTSLFKMSVYSFLGYILVSNIGVIKVMKNKPN